VNEIAHRTDNLPLFMIHAHGVIDGNRGCNRGTVHAERAERRGRRENRREETTSEVAAASRAEARQTMQPPALPGVRGRARVGGRGGGHYKIVARGFRRWNYAIASLRIAANIPHAA
jgi:hypothetical protein